LVRTDNQASKHRGISVLLVDMTAPGITVRPIRSMGGLGEINEIFFEDVVVPKENLLGPQDGGWPLIMTGLSFERTGIATHGRSLTTIKKLIDYVRTAERDGRKLRDDPQIRAKIADLYCRYRAARLISYRVTSMVEAGKEPLAEASMAWIHGGQATQDAARVGMEIVGWDGLLREGEPGAPIDGAMEREWIEMIPMSIGAGTVDIQRSIVAQRGLGLPKAG
jgi:alkylation response protein AidB-like acyl-CoA dehydrogenase